MTSDDPRILTVNDGSPSAKFLLFHTGEPLERVIKELLTRPAGPASRRPLKASRHRRLGGSVVPGSGKRQIAGRPGNQNRNSANCSYPGGQPREY